jgi:hypothetical protein
VTDGRPSPGAGRPVAGAGSAEELDAGRAAAAARQLDGSCPYCGGPLFKESWVLRCPRDHRFRGSFRRGAPAAPGADGRGAADGPPPPDTLVLRVVSHPDRAEIGRLHVYAVPPAPPGPPQGSAPLLAPGAGDGASDAP